MDPDSFDSPVSPEQESRPAVLTLFPDRIVWASNGFRGAETTRPAIALLIGARGLLTITTHGTDVHTSRAVLVAAHVSRSLEAERAGFFSLNLDPVHPACRSLRDKVLKGRDVLDLSEQLTPSLAGRVVDLIDGLADCAAALRISDEVLDHFFPGHRGSKPYDRRVVQAAAWLRDHVPPRADLERLAGLCHLSEGRLTHLFTQELGISIRSYLLWIKMHKAAQLFAQDMSLTDVAATIGFADSAHLSRVFRTYFSAAPSFLANHALVQVRACSAGFPPARE